MKRTIYVLSLAIVLFVLNYSLATANSHQGGGGTPPPTTNYGITIPNPLKNGTNSLYAFINLVINNVILPVGGVLAVIFIIYSGFLFVTARGNPTKLETAKQAFLWAAIGTAILLGAWAISLAIEATITQITS